MSRSLHAAVPALAALAAGALAPPALAQKIGSRVPTLPLVEFTGVQARSFDDFVGRAVLIEYFAHW